MFHALGPPQLVWPLWFHQLETSETARCFLFKTCIRFGHHCSQRRGPFALQLRQRIMLACAVILLEALVARFLEPGAPGPSPTGLPFHGGRRGSRRHLGAIFRATAVMR